MPGMTPAKSPFPGMDPYLEERWSDVHVKLIGFVGESLQPRLPRALRARSEERVLLEDAEGDTDQSYRSDVALVDTGRFRGEPRSGGVAVATVDPISVQLCDGPALDRFVQIIDTTSGNRVVTAIEILSPWNKGPGKLNKGYLQKLDDYARAGVSIVEIDLLRYPYRGRLKIDHVDLPAKRRAPYLTCLRRAWEDDRWWVYPMALRQPLPTIPIPLREGEHEIGLELQPLIERVYAAGGHDDIDYSRPPDPPLEAGDAAWAEGLIRDRRT
jgi:hypothetical protein